MARRANIDAPAKMMAMAKIGRNAPCPCGSGQKFKRCCGDLSKGHASNRARDTTALRQRTALEAERREAREMIRVAEQGRGRPIIATKLGEHQLVAVGDSVHFSKNWKYPADFLCDYIKNTLGPDWGNAEIAKPIEQRHPILKWYDAFCRFQQKGQSEASGGNYSGTVTGIVACYLGLAYNLYLLKHNAELQAKLVARLKHPEQFQGAYYELVIANCLIRAGFELTIEDENSRRTRHCEFAAVSKLTGTRYSVEVRMRSVAGLLGKTEGADINPTDKLIRRVNDALDKPSQGERLVFIDVNAQPIAPSADHSVMPRWMERAGQKLDEREKILEPGQRAYVFVTNLAFHRALDQAAQGHSILAHGLGIADFGKPGMYTLVQAWKHKQKHADAHRIIEALRSYPKIPNNFDGDLPLPPSAKNHRIIIGETYFFPETGPHGTLGRVTAASICPETKKMLIAITCPDGKNIVVTRDVTDEELAVYIQHPDAYFGVVRPASRKVETLYELFECMVEAHKKTPKERLLEMAKGHPEAERWATLDQSDVVLELCQAYAARVASEDKHLAGRPPPAPQQR